MIQWIRMLFINKQNYVWYLGYGSNLEKQRFLCYIVGGQPRGSNKVYDGARDKTPPLFSNKFIINHDLYFSKNSSAWNNGGVAFIDVELSNSAKTLARVYLITRQQFEDVARQETSSDNVLPIAFGQAIQNGFTIFKSPSWYGNVLNIGTKKGCPILALTSENTIQEYVKPDPAYLLTIMRGIHEVFKITPKEMASYFSRKRGVSGNYTDTEIEDLAKSIVNPRIKK